MYTIASKKPLTLSIPPTHINFENVYMKETLN